MNDVDVTRISLGCLIHVNPLGVFDSRESPCLSHSEYLIYVNLFASHVRGA